MRKVVIAVSERALLKRKVKGLLRKQWPRVLVALLLAALPMCAAYAVMFIFFNPYPALEGLLTAQSGALFDSIEDLSALIMQWMASVRPAVSEEALAKLVAVLPGQAIVVGVYLFFGLPVSVSLSGYLLSFLRGKQPSPIEAYGCFSGKYGRCLGGMLYRLFWLAIWWLAAFAAPVLVYVGGDQLIKWMLERDIFQLTLMNRQLIAYGVLIAICLIWFVSFTLQYINRLLAYALTPTAIAAQPRLPARRAVRVSRLLMRGSKFRLIGLCLSFLSYYLPAIFAGIAILALDYLSPLLNLSMVTARYIDWFLLGVIGANALVTLYVAPYFAASLNAFYIVRKREALTDNEISADEFGPKQKKAETEAQGRER